jgi:hypothetical protein
VTEIERSDRKLLKQVKVGGFAVLGWLMAEVAAAAFSGFGTTLLKNALNVAAIVVPLLIIAGLVWIIWRRSDEPGGTEAEPPVPLTSPRWFERSPLFGRVDEVRAGVNAVRTNGVVVVVGPRDIGTSAVGQAIVQQLINDHDTEQSTTFRFDLRSRSTSGPDDTAATAGRVVSPFDIDVPADDSDEVLRRVAGKLVDLFRATGGTLMLDNVSTPEQVSWLIREWPTCGPPFLVIAGEPKVAEAVDGSTVTVDQLGKQHLRQLWEAELAEPRSRRAKRWSDRTWKLLRAIRERGPDDLDRLLPYTLGRPKAVKLLAAEVRRPGSQITVPGLLRELAAAGSHNESAVAPLVGVWRIILRSTREGLSDEAGQLLDALAELPVTGLARPTIEVLLNEQDAKALDELWDRNLIEEVDGRFRLPQELRLAVTETNTEQRRADVVKSALPKLLAYYAKLVASWSMRLDKEPAAAGTWFKTSEASLWPLVSTGYVHDDSLMEEVLDHLVAIADGLEKWYVREQQPRNLEKVGVGLFALAERVGRPDLEALGAIRTAIALRIRLRPGDAVTQLDLADERAEKAKPDEVRRDLEARIWVERALLGLAGAEEGLSRVDQSATVLLNRAVLCIARNAVDEAQNFLEKAERLASAAGDLGCVAHIFELQGIALSQKDGQLVAAAALWKQALVRFENLGERHGEARCRQHLGSAAITDTRVAAYLRDGSTEKLPLPQAAKEAVELLVLAKKLREGQPDTGLADHYLAEARGHLA